MESRSEVVFTDLVRTTATNNTVIKNSGSGGWNAGAFSTASVGNNGYAETVLNQTGKNRVFGLSHSNNPNNNEISSVEYGFSLSSWLVGEIVESGTAKAYFFFPFSGDRLRVAIEDGVVRYYQNNNLIYVSSKTPALPLYVDLAFDDKGGEIANVFITNNTGTTIRAFSNQNPSTISSYKWYQNNTVLPFTGSEITIRNFINGDVIRCEATPVSGHCAGIALKSNKIIVGSEEVAPIVDFNISAVPAVQGCYMAVEDAVWEGNIATNFELSGGYVKKTSGYNTSNGGFYSKNKVADNGYLEFQTGEINSRRMLGLSSYDAGSSESSIQYAFYIESGGNLAIYESGSWQAAGGKVNTNDKMRIEVDNGVVKYYVNHDLLYVSSKAPTLPLLADGTIQSIGGSIKNAVIANPTQGIFSVLNQPESSNLTWKINGQNTSATGNQSTLDNLNENDLITCSYILEGGCRDFLIESNSIKIIKNKNIAPHLFYIQGVPESNAVGFAEEQVVWNPQSLENVSNIQNNLTKVQKNGPFNAGASSLNTVKNNGYFDFTVSEKNKTKAIGLSKSDINYDYKSTDFAIHLASNGKFTIYESGTWRFGNQSYEVGDILRIAIVNNVVKYYRNGTLIYTSNVNPAPPLLVDISMADIGGTVQNARIGNENNKSYTAHVTGLGQNPLMKWYVNGIFADMTGTSFYDGNIENGDIITCSVLPDFPGCNSDTRFESNSIRYTGPVTSSNWLGAVSTAWTNSSNWSDGVPNETLSARIRGGRPHQPKISSVVNARNVIIEPNAKITFSKKGELLIYGNLLVEGNFDAGSGSVTFKGDGKRKVKGNNIEFNKLTIDLSSPELEIEYLSDLTIRNETSFISGKLKSNSQEIVYLHGSSSNNGSINSFIDGRVSKVGNNGFLFPIGSGDKYAPVEISAPQKSSDIFTAQYFYTNPNSIGYFTNLQDGTMDMISNCEYWEIDRTKGNAMVSVSLSFENARSCGIEDPNLLQVVHWNGNNWENIGIDTKGYLENALSIGIGILTSRLPIDFFSPFTIGTISSVNPLPIELASFSIGKKGLSSKLEWITDSESNNAYFTLERSDNALDFYQIATIDGAGSSREKLKYSYIDSKPTPGVNYYRLSQTDFDGTQVYFDIKSVYFEYNNDIVIYPNPSQGIFTIVRSNENPVHMRIMDENGRTLWLRDTNDMLTQVSVYHLSAGMYFLNIDDGHHQVTEKIIIR